MVTKENTKLFIDTNIFLGLYNSNDSGNVKAFMKTLFKNKKILITTEQSVNEYLRNRTRIINEFKNTFIDPAATAHTSSFVSSFSEYKDYLKCVKELKGHRKKVINKIDSVLSDVKQDYIYESFVKLWKAGNTLSTTDECINLATKRKILGNPPGGDKFSSGDEVIWETLINAVKCNLIIVSKDRTYTQNKEFLQHEYRTKTGYELVICDTVHVALSSLGIEMDQGAVEAEDNIRWIDIIIQALEQLGLKVIVRGDGAAVTDQMPRSGSVITEGGRVVLYTDGAEAEPTVSVPSFAGMTPQQVLSTASTYGLNVELKGIHKDDYSCHASTQSIEPGTMVTTGTIVSVQFIYNESIE